MQINRECCSNTGCGCQQAIFPVDKECPTCGKKLRLVGRSQLLELRLVCQICGYQSPLLRQEELRELL